MEKAKRFLAITLVVLMLLTSAPLAQLTGLEWSSLPFSQQAKAAGVSGYSAGAAVQWAKDHWNDYDSKILGAGYWNDGGDCANFVSQCLYMGGLNMNNKWNTSGKWHYTPASNASFINAHNLYTYLISIGGQAIQNPSAHQISLGDIIFYRTTQDGLMHHSAIVVGFDNGTPVVAAHSSSGTRYCGSAYTLGYSGDRIYLVKMYGSTCSVPNPRSFDVYIVNNCGAAGRRCFTAASPYAGYNFTFSAGEYCHVDRVVYEYGQYYGHTYGYGANGWFDGWVLLKNCSYQRHVNSASVSHAMGGWYTESNATCTTQGVQKSVCSKCGYAETYRFGPNGHNWVSATCTSAQYCRTCGTVSGSALGHSWGGWGTVTAATCTTNGSQARSCSRCGAKETSTLNASGHAWSSNWVSNNNGTHKKVCSRNSSHVQTANCTYGAWQQVTAPTCTTTGLKKRSCTSCGFSQTASVAAIGHSWDSGVVVKNATCVEKEKILYTCRNDQNHTYYAETEINADNHTGGTYTTGNKAAVCTANGYTGDTYCASCNKMITKGATIQAKGHDYKKTVTAPGCTTKGYTTYKCSVCAHSYVANYTDAKGHDWDNGVVIKTATCHEEGTKKYTCKTDSSHTYTEQIGKNTANHTGGTQVRNAVAATCTTNGYTGDTYCLGCDSVLTYGTTINATGHNWDNGVITKTATCHEEGTKKYTCKTDSSHTYTEQIGKNTANHTGGTQVKNTVAATCTTNGYTGDTYCLGCDSVLTHGTTINATGHDWNDGEITKDATCFEEGTKKYTCKTDSSHTYTEQIGTDAANHAGGTQVRNAVAATCTTNGYTGDTYCLGCDSVLTYGTTINATGHDWNDGEITKDATCFEEGTKKYTCKTDSSHTYTEQIGTDTANHAGGTQVKNATAPTCTTDGYTGDTHCCGCDALLAAGDTINATGHNWDNGVITKTATCHEEGTKKYTCKTDSSHTYTEQISMDAANHAGGTQVKNATAPTCTTDGYTGDTYCLGCDTVLANGTAINATGHNWDNGVTTKTATCHEEGTKKYTCKTDSSHTYTEQIGKNTANHTGGTQVRNKVTATCTTNGYTGDTYCLGCETVLTYGTTINATGHSWNSGSIISVSTCCKEGVKKYTCLYNGSHTYTEQLSLDPTNHKGGTMIKNDVVATCTTDGYTGDTHCCGCDALLASGTIINATGHDWNKWESNNNGTHTRTCKNDSTHTETALCNFTDYVVTKWAKCTTAGMKERTCRDCGNVEQENIAPYGHESAGLNIENQIPATCTAYGSYDLVYYCRKCESELSRETRTTDELGHDDEITISDMKIGSTFEFGSYPQSEVTDEALLAELNAYEPEWINYGYLYGINADDDDVEGDMVNTLDMCYADITHNGEKYRAVTFSQYRPSYTGGLPEEKYSTQYENGYYINTVYWFKYEPVSWRVADPEKGIVISENILDSQPINNYLLQEEAEDEGVYLFWGDEDKTHAATDYLLSSMIGFLDNLYENEMFTADEKSFILPTSITNNGYDYFGPGLEEMQYIGSSDTTSVEYLYLLGLDDIVKDTTDLQFSFDLYLIDNILKYAPEFLYSGCLDAGNTDYARSQGLFADENNPSYFWFRDAVCDFYTYSLGFLDGDIDYGEYIEYTLPSYCTYIGLRPAMTIDPSYVVATGRTEAVQPTCTETGCTESAVCARCQIMLLESTQLPALGHEEYVSAQTVAPTCTQDGCTQEISCTRCNIVLTGSEKIAAHGHECNNEWVVTKVPTCLEKGEETAKCIRHDNGATCDKTYIREVDMLAHQLVKTDAKAASCLEDGNDAYFTCVQCNKYFADENAQTEISENAWIIAAAGHNDGQWICIDEGYEDFTGYSKEDCDTLVPVCGFSLHFELHCTRCTDENVCNEILDEYEITAADHDMVRAEYKEPSCVEGGYVVNKCTKCEYTESYLTEATQHNWSEWYTEQEAVCVHVGSMGRHCLNNCGTAESKSIEAPYSEHDYMITETVSTECAAGTNLNHLVCSRCGESECDDCTTAQTPHHYWDGNPTLHTIQKNNEQSYAPSCTENGLNVYECINETCKYAYSETIPPLEHDYNEVNRTPATCTESAKIYMECSRDSAHNYIISDDSATGHAWGEWTTVTPATCEEDGLEKRVCGNDATHTEENVLPAIGHDWGEWETVTEPTYDATGEAKQVCKNDASHINTKALPVLTRPSEENESIQTGKTVEYDPATGEAVIRLVACAKGEKVTVNARTPLDIVLVLDQSGSMEGELLEKLKTAADDFINAIYADAVDNGIDHRIAMVGFAMQNQYNFGSEYPQYLNTEILTTGGAPVQYNSLSASEMKEVYKNALVYVNADGTLNPVLTLAKDNLQAKGATAADLGLDMACQIFAENENDGSRKRIVVFMTDGVPTYKSDYMDETASNAIAKADLLKDAYTADLYSVGVLSGSNTSKAKTFLNNIASLDENNNALYFDCADADKLVEDFKTIATQSTTITTAFADITLVDTVSAAFTLTALQEAELRKNAIETLGIANEDITITRYADGTTQIELAHIDPVAVASGADVHYVIDFAFRVTANENALIAGSYGSNTDNAGVLLGTSDVYENNFAVPGAEVEQADGVIYFTVNGIVYHVVRVHTGESIDTPAFTMDGEYTFSGWDIPDEIVFEGGKITVDATLTQKEYTVTWITAEGATVVPYYAGDIIEAPSVGLNTSGEMFLAWDKAVPVTMPAEDLVFTATYGAHTHSYEEKVLVKASCGIAGKLQYVCVCGDSYMETTDALTHKWATRATSNDNTETAYSYVYCENCGESPDQTLTYTVKGTSGNKQVTYDLKLTDASDITVQPDGQITVSLPVPQSMKNARNVKIYRQEADGSLTNLNGTVKNGYITFTTDHFSIYLIEAEYDCEATGNHTDADNNQVCDLCGTAIQTQPDDNDPSAPDVYEPEIPDEDESPNCDHMCHKTGIMGILWKIIRFFWKLFKMNPVCECGAAHY